MSAFEQGRVGRSRVTEGDERSELALCVLGMSTEQRGETCSRSSPLGVLTEETHHQRDKGAESVRPARGRPVEV